MGIKLKVPLPEGLDLGGGYTLEWDAVAPASGTTVAGVAVSSTSLLVEQLAGTVRKPTLTPPPVPPPPPPPVPSPPPTGVAAILALIQDIEAKLSQAAADLSQAPPDATDALPLLQAAQTELGQAIADVQQIISQPPPPPPPPPPVPPPVGSDPDPFRWDATTAPLDPHSAELVPAFVGYALSSGAFVHPNVAYAVVPRDGSGTYPVSTAGKPGLLDGTIHVPVGTLSGTSTDHHLTIVDWHTGRQHDLWEAVVSGGTLTGWRGGCSIPIGAIQQPRGPNSSSNAALLNGMGGVLRPEQVAAHDLSHPLVFACPRPGTGTTQRYPSNATKGWTDTALGGPFPTHLAQAAWFRFPPGLAFPAMDPLSLYLCHRIQARGMFLSDRNTNDLNFKSADLGGGGRSLGAWHAAGVSLSGLPNFSLRLSGAIPWHSLQLLVPPHA